MPWARGLVETELGKYHGLTCAYYSEDRALRYILSKPFANSILGFCKLRTKHIRFFSLLDLKPYKIGVVRGYVNTEEFDGADYLLKEEAVDDFMNIRKLVRSRIDLVLVDKYVMQYIIATKYPIAQEKVAFMSPPLEVKPLHIAFSRKIDKIQKIVDDFNSALSEMYEDQSIDIIMKNHGFIE